MRIDCQGAIKAIIQYLNNDVTYPFMVVANSSSDLRQITNSLPDYVHYVFVSDFCLFDSLPDEDAIYDVMINTSTPILIKGIGDFISLSGNAGFLWRIADKTFPQKIIVFCRNQGMQLEKLHQLNSKFGNNRWCELLSPSDVSVVRVNEDVPIPKIEGFKALLKRLEAYASGILHVSTNVQINCSKVIKNSYDAVREMNPSLVIPESVLSDKQWTEFLKDGRLDVDDPFHWRTYLKYLIRGAGTPYFKLVIKNSRNYDNYRKEIIDALLRLPHKSDSFESIYQERKRFLRQYSGENIGEYVRNTLSKGKERIYYLTDNTLVERHAIIEEVARYGLDMDVLIVVYPDLAAYFTEYKFKGREATLFTEYFNQYKLQKATNVLYQDFLDKVVELSKKGNRKYNSLETRNQKILRLDKQKCGLLWIDALGVEFLGYIKCLAKEMGLWVEIDVGRAILPTLTENNRSFYDEWTGYKLPKESRLDNLKHEGVGAASSMGPAIHMAEELVIIRESMDKIRNTLINHTAGVESFLLVSDHGASRLCVLNHHENRWTIKNWSMEESGKHSGRCCMVSDVDECPESATQDNDYWVLANYDRFKGGRLSANSVEVHGGASLEEVLVPVIKISLINEQVMCWINNYRDEIATVIKPLDGDMIMEIYCSKTSANIAIVIKGKTYIGCQSTLNPAIFSVNLSKYGEMWHTSSVYEGVIYDGDNELSLVKFKVQRIKRMARNDRDGTDFFTN